MVRRGPASVFARKSSSKPFLEDRPDRFRPPPYMPDGDPAIGSAGGMMVQDHSVWAFPSAMLPLVCPGRPARRAVSFTGWLLERTVDPVWQTFSGAVVIAEFFAGGSVVMQAIDQTNPANSRAIAVTTT